MTSALKKFKERALARPEVRKAYDALAEEFSFIDEVLKARAGSGLTQSELAARVGTTQSAIARLESGKLLLLTVDGRQPGVSAGMSLNMLADLLLEFGAVEAINLDGGGSTAMVVRDKLANRPSDQTGERPVSDSILVFSKPN